MQLAAESFNTYLDICPIVVGNDLQILETHRIFKYFGPQYLAMFSGLYKEACLYFGPAPEGI